MKSRTTIQWVKDDESEPFYRSADGRFEIEPKYAHTIRPSGFVLNDTVAKTRRNCYTLADAKYWAEQALLPKAPPKPPPSPEYLQAAYEKALANNQPEFAADIKRNAAKRGIELKDPPVSESRTIISRLIDEMAQWYPLQKDLDPPKIEFEMKNQSVLNRRTAPEAVLGKFDWIPFHGDPDHRRTLYAFVNDAEAKGQKVYHVLLYWPSGTDQYYVKLTPDELAKLQSYRVKLLLGEASPYRDPWGKDLSNWADPMWSLCYEASQKISQLIRVLKVELCHTSTEPYLRVMTKVREAWGRDMAEIVDWAAKDISCWNDRPDRVELADNLHHYIKNNLKDISKMITPEFLEWFNQVISSEKVKAHIDGDVVGEGIARILA